MLPKRIQSKINNIGCWEWTGSIDRAGYGRIRWEGRNALAHRVVYSLIKGNVPKELDHLCRNRKCVNPDHLEGVTRAENVKRGLSGQKKTHCRRGHELTKENRGYRGGCKICKRAQRRKN